MHGRYFTDFKRSFISLRSLASSAKLYTVALFQNLMSCSFDPAANVGSCNLLTINELQQPLI